MSKAEESVGSVALRYAKKVTSSSLIITNYQLSRLLFIYLHNISANHVTAHFVEQSIVVMTDPTTQSNYLQIATEYVAFDWTVDFQRKVVEGSAIHDLSVKMTGVSEVIFDTADLYIQNVEVAGKQTAYEVKAKHPVMGSALHIPLPFGLKSGSSVKVKILYQTTADCTALQWLEKEQTQGNTFPYLFSQCQPIYARSLTPCQGES